MNVFRDFGLNDQILTEIEKQGITNPTKIQDESIPYIIKGQDVIGESSTGSGKTLAFGCGIMEKVHPGKGLQALVLTPTRELAEQVRKSLYNLSSQNLNVVSVYGGVSIENQVRDLYNADVTVATPGRLLDHLQRRTIDISKIKILVLDEADRMLDMGFIDDVEKIIRKCPKERQTLFFSATILPSIKKLAYKYMKDPKRISVNKYVDPSKLKQLYFDIPKNIKLSLLVHLLQNEKSNLVMVFCNTRRTTDFVVKNLKANSIDAIAIHGGLSQNKRTKTLNLFNKGKLSVLVCTDVAARGLHIDNVSHIYNYEIPSDPTDYIHRIGRTARAGEEGEVINLLCEIDYDNFSKVLRDNRDFKIEKKEVPRIRRISAIKENNFRKPNRNFRRFPRRKSNRRY